MSRWQYLVGELRMTRQGGAEVVIGDEAQTLYELGQRGWELIVVVGPWETAERVGASAPAIFKRPAGAEPAIVKRHNPEGE